MQLATMNMPMEQIAEVCRRYRVLELSAFGSILRDDFRSDSDVDLLVEFEPGVRHGLFSYLGCQRELSDVLGRRVDLVQKNGLKFMIREEVLNSARVIYAK